VLVDESVPKAEYEKVVEEREQYRELYLKALEQCRKLELGILGQKRERLSPSEAQLSIALLAALVGAAGAEIVEAQAASEPEGQRVREHVRK
jgi:hypothetical protein